MPVYIDREKPDWFVPSTRTDDLLRACTTCQQHSKWAEVLAEFCERHKEAPDQVGRDLARLEYLLDRGTPAPYLGRSRHLRLGALKEIWFHLTDTCNLSCVHCLFSASP
ncbi:MAG: hypothetical protein D3906_15325, partial [Candidatus Electrothrix sp. AUS1_2]|nr:hypothetical protein [Candidatus Electrothrix sp. AUS1_2]